MFTEPSSEEQRSGLRTWEKPKTPYRRFIETEGIPIYGGIGFRDVREIELGAWERLGGNGAYLDLDGLEGIKGMYVLEIPGGGVINAEKHFYHEFYLVVEGRGTTETWRDGSSAKQIFEWQPGSLFYLPPNVLHRLVNATTDRVLIVAATNAPPLFNLIRDTHFIFNNDYPFPNHYRDDENFYRYDEQVYAFPMNKRAQARSNFFPDVANCELPLDNQRAPGFRRIQIAWQGFEDDYCGFLGQYPPGRYSRAHYHGAEAVLVCLKGAGYTYNWPRQYGINPWRDGHEDKVRVLDYVPGGLVVAAPGGGQWYHQHFGVSAEPFRVLNFWGGPEPTIYTGLSDEGESSHLPLSQGGASIGYSAEDPFVRENFERALGAVGLASTMPDEFYRTD